MSKRKQVRPSKFDAKKGCGQSDVIESQSDDKHHLDDNFAVREPKKEEDADERKTDDDSNVEKTVAAVARASFVSSVIQTTGRKRTISCTTSRMNYQDHEDNETNDTIVNGVTDSRTSSPRSEPQRDEFQLDDNQKRARIANETLRLSQCQRTVITSEGEGECGSTANDIDVTKEVPQMRLMKTLQCQYCQTRFSNPNTLEAHQTMYCTKIPMDANDADAVIKVSSSRSRSLDGATLLSTICQEQRARAAGILQSPPNVGLISPNSVSSSPPSVILLPCAYTGSNVIQVIGKPQTIVPVAVPSSLSSLDFGLSPLLLEEAWCTAVDIPRANVPISTSASAQSNGSIPKSEHCFTLPLAIRSANGEGSSLEQAAIIRRHRSSEECRQGKQRRSPPLDLTTKASSEASSNCGDMVLSKRRSSPRVQDTVSFGEQQVSVKCNPQIPSTSSNVYPKNYACSKCGVAFSSRKTLEGHQAYYCKATKSLSSVLLPSLSPHTSVASTHTQALCCQYCDHTAVTAWQLVQHMKTAHSLGAAYLCTLCGYRGFSMRGMKSHFKHAHSNEPSGAMNSDEEAYLGKYIKRTELFAEYEAAEGEDCRRSTSSNGEPACDDSPTGRKGDTPPALVKQGRRREQNRDENGCASTNGEKMSEDDRCSAASPTCPTLLSKYACQYCSYKSPYKGNVKRHLALVHKADKQKR